MLQLLCDAGAQPDVRDENGWTALHYAAACPTGPEALHFLCELLADGFIDTQCSEGNTALHVAAGCGCIDNVCALLETAANPHVCNFNGESAYHLALRNNRIQCAVVINDYQSVPVTSYTLPPLTEAKESVLAEASVAASGDWGGGPTMPEGGEWIESFTEDGCAYYYNSVTGSRLGTNLGSTSYRVFGKMWSPRSAVRVFMTHDVKTMRVSPTNCLQTTSVGAFLEKTRGSSFHCASSRWSAP